jgi:hypothetical protein
MIIRVLGGRTMARTKKQLNRAFKLIKREEIDEALDILRPIVAEEPENVHAWWLLAYSATEPREVRQALIQVLRIDPDYENAPKAREMLKKLNAQYPPDEAEIAQYPELQPSSSFAASRAEESLFGEIDFEPTPFDVMDEGADYEPAFDLDEDPFEDVFGDPDFVPQTEDLFVPQDDDDPFAELDRELAPEPVGGTAPTPRSPDDEDEGKVDELQLAMLDLGLDPEAQHDDQVLAAAEELVAEKRERRSGRSRARRMLITFALLTLISLAVILVLTVLLGGGAEDPGELKIVEASSDPAMKTQSAVNASLQTMGMGSESQAIIASSDLGDALYVELCGEANPDLPQLVSEGMEIATQQALALEGELDAVGVSINMCQSAEHDTLYRAVVSIEDAKRYLDGELDWAAYQGQWDTP